ncbi:MAG: hypothetical protein HOY69_03980 [Streptomyces sp.]|nr:hypothetical protein [Streptomyces sp.]
MKTSDWILDIVLILIVFRQLREERLTVRSVLVPLAIIGWAAVTYLRHIPSAGNDLVLVGVFAGAGVVFGLSGGLLTRVRLAGGQVRVRASWAAAALWVGSMGFRLVFAVWSSHPSGGAAVVRFSVAHQITSPQAWVAALILMAFGEAVVRLGTIVVRGRLLVARAGRAEPAVVVRRAGSGVYV